MSQPNLGHKIIDLFYDGDRIKALIMSLLPKIKECPNCSAINILRINGVTYDNNFENLSDWTLRKRFNCRKCKIDLGLFVKNSNKEEKLVWIDFLMCESVYSARLEKLKKIKDKYKQKNNQKEYLQTIKEIESIQNQIRLNKIKLKIKTKIQNKGLLI